jgi:hypothetical protein
MGNSRQSALRLGIVATVLAALAGQSLAQPPDIQGQWEIEYKVGHGTSTIADSLVPSLPTWSLFCSPTRLASGDPVMLLDPFTLDVGAHGKSLPT